MNIYAVTVRVDTGTMQFHEKILSYHRSEAKAKEIRDDLSAAETEIPDVTGTGSITYIVEEILVD